MPTIQISDQGLEDCIAERARQTGKTEQELVEGLLAENLPEDNGDDFVLAKLDPRKHSHIIDYHIPDSTEFEKVRLFEGVEDSVEYVRELRKKAWR